MEVFFTQYELSFLDDVIPESQKREKDDMEQKSVEKRDEVSLDDGSHMTSLREVAL